jgi:selenide, water dikinase
VYVWEGGPALVQTVDFFTPIVDDPFTYGQIAAANALSDVYAMGGRPVTALAIAGFPKKGLDAETIAAVFQGGFDKLREGGVVLLGGHTVQDEEIKFGYAVTGAVDPKRMLTNAGAKPGDALILTKPLGTGVVGTAIKFNRASDSLIREAVASMTLLNNSAAAVLGRFEGVHACTDVTGFGLLGHATEIAVASGATLTIESAGVPLLPGVLEIVTSNRSGGMASNQEHFGAIVEFQPDVADVYHDLLFDPQTSGGLLAVIDQTIADIALQALVAEGLRAARIGSVGNAVEMKVIVR